MDWMAAAVQIWKPIVSPDLLCNPEIASLWVTPAGFCSTKSSSPTRLHQRFPLSAGCRGADILTPNAQLRKM
jgi:hypothetical protein